MSKISVLEKNITAYIRRCIEKRVFPGCSVGVVTYGRPLTISEGALTYDHGSPKVTGGTVYDIASITKAVPTSCCALKLIEEGRIGLSTRLVDFVPEYEGNFRDRIVIKHLLTHTLDFDLRLSEIKTLPPGEILSSIFRAHLRSPPGERFCYANATSILLGLVVERSESMGLDKAAAFRFFDPLGMKRTTFSPEIFDRKELAPTEKDPWRGRIIQGEVHDESAWALRPVMVAGSAGLFSTAADLLRFLCMLMNGGVWDGRRVFKSDTIRLMHQNALPARLGVTTALGWELDNPDFMGTFRTASTFGKTGFTGCAIVADHSKSAGFILMTNHTFPQRREDRSAINEVRRALADMVFGKSGYNNLTIATVQ